MTRSVPAVNIPSGEPAMLMISIPHVLVAQCELLIPPEVSCLYSVISRRRAVELLAPLEDILRETKGLEEESTTSR
jgi:hypothetical protein